jgi:hypothetical protein
VMLDHLGVSYIAKFGITLLHSWTWIYYQLFR